MSVPAQAVYVATKNRGKVAELRAILAAASWEVHEYPAYVEAEEGEASYAANAAAKAWALATQLRAAGIQAPVIADDSGLEVAALAGRPGVLSARYGGTGATWADRRRALLAEVAQSASLDRDARFVCAIHFVDTDGTEASALATVSGTLVDPERGDGGFSYDALFLYAPLEKTFGELSPEEKNAVSHRSQAARALVARVAERRGLDTGM